MAEIERSTESVIRTLKLLNGGKVSELEGPVYLAGPMTGLPEFNFPAFREAEILVKDLYPGIVVENPIENGNSDVGTDLPYEYYFRKGLKQLLECKSILMLPGWMDSKGASEECKIALMLNMPVYTLIDGVVALLKAAEPR